MMYTTLPSCKDGTRCSIGNKRTPGHLLAPRVTPQVPRDFLRTCSMAHVTDGGLSGMTQIFKECSRKRFFFREIFGNNFGASSERGHA